MKTTFYRPHPFTIVHNLKAFTFMLLIPFARGFVTALGGGLRLWLAGAWLDILVVLLIFAFSAMRWLSCSYAFDEKGLQMSSGILIHRQIFIPITRISTLSVVYPFYLRPFRAARLRADTLAGSRTRNDLSLFVHRDEAYRILQNRIAQPRAANGLTRQYRPKNLYIAALAAFSSSSFAGIFFISTLISQTGQLLGNEFSDRIYGTFEHITQLLAFGIPPAAAALAYVLIFGWLCAFTINFIRNKNFCLRRCGNLLHITGGIFTKRNYIVDVSAINYLDIRQSVLSWVLQLCSVHIHAAGYQKYQDDVLGVIPAVKKHDVYKTLHMFFPEFSVASRQLWHNAGALFKFIGDACWGCLILPALTLFLRWMFDDWAAFITWVGFMLCIPAYWFLIVRLIDYFTSGLAEENGRFTLRYSSGYFLHTIVIPRNKVSYVCLRQSPIQRFDKKCDVLVFSFSEQRSRHHIRNLDWKSAEALFRR